MVALLPATHGSARAGAFRSGSRPSQPSLARALARSRLVVRASAEGAWLPLQRPFSAVHCLLPLQCTGLLAYVILISLNALAGLRSPCIGCIGANAIAWVAL